MSNQTVDLDNVDVSRDRYSGYGSQQSYQKDLRLFYEGKICGGLKQDRRFCKNKPLENGRCKFHGGKSPTGLDHPKTTHGRYSKYLPKELMEKYKEANEDEELLSLRDETALITARIFELSEKANDAVGKSKLTEIISTYKRWMNARKKGLEGADLVKVDFEELLDDLETDMKIWDEIGNMINLKRRLVDSEMKKMSNMQQYVPVEKVMLLVGALMDIVVNEVESLDGVLMDKDKIEDTNTAIARKFRSITNRD